jgi:hypothetical protein
MEAVVGPIHLSIFIHLMGFLSDRRMLLRFQVLVFPFFFFLKNRERLQLDRRVA